MASNTAAAPIRPEKSMPIAYSTQSMHRAWWHNVEFRARLTRIAMCPCPTNADAFALSTSQSTTNQADQCKTDIRVNLARNSTASTLFVPRPGHESSFAARQDVYGLLKISSLGLG